MKQREITAWIFFVTGMMVSEVLGILLRAFNLDNYSLWIVLAFYSVVAVYLSIKKDKLGEQNGN